MRFYFSVALLAVLGACASLTEEQCLNGNWQSIGYADGARGRLESYISRHFDACEKVGITPDVAAWQSGRAQGLPLYCTAENAYSVGRGGDNLSPVCPASQQRALYHAWDWGQEYYLLTADISELESDARDIRNRIATEFLIEPLTPEQILTLSNLRSQEQRLETEIRRLERRRRRYASVPY